MPADRERVIDRFVRLENSRTRPGSGLGLSLAAAVAHLHGGKLVKGFLKSAKTHDLEALFRHKLGGMESDIPIVSQESSAVVK